MREPFEREVPLGKLRARVLLLYGLHVADLDHHPEGPVHGQPGRPQRRPVRRPLRGLRPVLGGLRAGGRERPAGPVQELPEAAERLHPRHGQGHRAELLRRLQGARERLHPGLGGGHHVKCVLRLLGACLRLDSGLGEDDRRRNVLWMRKAL